MNNNSQKLQKFLARQGLGSRREIERYIAQGRITVNHQIAHLGVRVKTGDRVQLDQTPVLTPNFTDALATRDCSPILLYYKPVGEICTKQDPEGRPTVFSRLHSALPLLQRQQASNNSPFSTQDYNLPSFSRWIMIGRLDFNTMGLLLFTTNGALAHRLLHPQYEIEREYAVRVRGRVTQDILVRLKSRVQFKEGDFGAFSSIQAQPKKLSSHFSHKNQKISANHWYHVILKEGKYREVRRLWASEGITVSRLIRVRFGSVCLPQTMKAGQWQILPKDTVKTVCSLVGL